MTFRFVMRGSRPVFLPVDYIPAGDNPEIVLLVTEKQHFFKNP